jgi:quinol monooxygenase YgiN
MPDVVVIATAKAKPGNESELERALREVAKPTRQQPGCVRFSLYRSEDDPGVVVGVERWKTKADHDRHLQGRTSRSSRLQWATSLQTRRGLSGTRSLTRPEVHPLPAKFTHTVLPPFAGVGCIRPMIATHRPKLRSRGVFQ